MPLEWPSPGAAAADFLLRPRRLSLLLGGSLVCAAAFCLCLFDQRFLLGTSPVWQAARGLVHNSWADISTALSGYNYFVRDAWTLPLFQVSKLGAPAGVSIIFTDSIPVVAMCGRLLYRATGMLWNPYGAWTALCFIASALSMTALAGALGQRSIAAALMATVSGLCMPALLERWGHMSLLAQWEVVLALVVYVRAPACRSATGIAAAALLLAMLVLWTHAYLAAMVMGILAAAFVQALLDRRLRLRPAAAIAALFAIVLGGLGVMSGYVSNQGSLAAGGFGVFSMNLLSPVVPQFSALFPVLGEQMIDATGGQYEGFSYLGAGILLLVIATLPWTCRAAVRSWRRHACLLAVLLGFVMFALSNQVYAADWHLLSLPLPAPLLRLAEVFRSSGRFIWPCLYMLTAVAIAAAPLLWGRAGAWLLLAAAMLQVIDTSPLRAALAARMAASDTTPLDQASWADAIRQHQFLRVLPAFGCMTDQFAQGAEAAIELQLLASQADVATNTVYASRHAEDCASPLPAALAPDELRVYLHGESGGGQPAGIEPHCAVSSTLAVCSLRLDAARLAALSQPP